MNPPLFWTKRYNWVFFIEVVEFFKVIFRKIDSKNNRKVIPNRGYLNAVEMTGLFQNTIKLKEADSDVKSETASGYIYLNSSPKYF